MAYFVVEERRTPVRAAPNNRISARVVRNPGSLKIAKSFCNELRRSEASEARVLFLHNNPRQVRTDPVNNPV